MATLTLKSRQPTADAPAPPSRWICKPCGTSFETPTDIADDEAVRCPKCTAKLGLASDFRSDPPRLQRLRARPDLSTPAGTVAAPEPRSTDVVRKAKRKIVFPPR